VATFTFCLPSLKRNFRFAEGLWVIEDIFSEVSRLWWSLFTLVMSLLGLKSSFFCCLWVVFPLLGRQALERLYLSSSPTQRKTRDLRWLILHLTSLSLPLLLSLYLGLTMFTMFIPILGRAGSTLNPDLLIGYKAVALTLACLSFLCPLTVVLRKPVLLITSLYIVTLAAMATAATTQLGFPYTPHTAPHRALVVHTERHFHNREGKLDTQDSGYFLLNLDRNSPSLLRGWLAELGSPLAKEISARDCEKHLYCGMPVYYPAMTLLKVNHWLPAPKIKAWTPTQLQLVTIETTSINTRKLLFKAQGPDHMGVFLSPALGVSLKSWSLAGGKVLAGPPWKGGRATHYIFHSHGKEQDTFTFWLELEVPRSHYEGNELLDMAITGHFIHGQQMKSAEFLKFLDQFPGWSYPVGWTAYYKAYKF